MIKYHLLLCFTLVAVCGFSQSKSKKPPLTSPPKSTSTQSPLMCQVANADFFTGGWEVLSLKTSGREENVKDVTFGFAAGTMVVLEVGCNKVYGYYNIDGSTITFKDLTPGQADEGCTQQVNLENTLISVLQSQIVAYSIGWDDLILKDAAGNMILKARRPNSISDGR